MRLLYAEDETAMAEAVADILTFHKYTVEMVDNGQDALDFAMEGNYDGIILDIMMPNMDGLTVLRKLRAAGDHTPVLLLTAKSEVADRIEGLDLGADDYLPKPFVMEELLARVRAMTRRKTEFSPNDLTIGNITLSRETFDLKGPSGTQRLGSKEFQMLEMMMVNKNTLISTERFMERIWGYDSDAEINVVWVFISYLRKKLVSVGADVEIKAARGVGYTLAEKQK
jgi:DNA-binding response OmpR family regulator